MGIVFDYKCSGGNFARNRLFHVSLFLLLFLLFFTKDKPLDIGSMSSGLSFYVFLAK